MSTSFQQPGEVLEFTAPTGGVTRNVPVLIGGMLVMPTDSVAQTLPFRGEVCGVHQGPKATGQSWAEGAVIYWDNTAGKFTTTTTANFRVGCAAVAALTADAIGFVRLNGVAVTAVGGAAP